MYKQKIIYKLKAVRDKFQRVSELRPTSSSVSQRSLINSWRIRYKLGDDVPHLWDVGFREYSQNEEDGILLYIFALLGMETRSFVEICAGDGIECNTTNLIVHHGWTGLLVDGNPANIHKAKQFYSHIAQTLVWPPKIAQKWVTAGNINELIQEHGLSGNIDLLSIDVDGVDYWLWKAVDIISPRVVVIEINNRLGPEKRLTVPYRDDFQTEVTAAGSEYGGASISALISLGKEKGYRFVGTNKICTNGFFVRNDLEHPWLPETSPHAYFSHERTQYHLEHIQEKVLKKDWEEV
jgi:hypothetical protein